MDNLNSTSFESELRLHDSCFDKCVNSFDTRSLDKGEKSCIRNCFRQFAQTVRVANDTFRPYFHSIEGQKPAP